MLPHRLGPGDAAGRAFLGPPLHTHRQERGGDEFGVPQHLQGACRAEKAVSATAPTVALARPPKARRRSVSKARSTSASTLGRKSTAMQMTKMRKACSVPVTLQKRGEGADGDVGKAGVALEPEHPVKGQEEKQPEGAGQVAKDAQAR